MARFGARDVKRLMADAGIVRNRRKIDAAIENARAAALSRGTAARCRGSCGRFGPARHRAPRSGAELPAATTESTELAKELKSHGFRFVGPTTAYALMQACGLVNDHIAGCAVRREVTDAQRAAVRMLPAR